MSKEILTAETLLSRWRVELCLVLVANIIVYSCVGVLSLWEEHGTALFNSAVFTALNVAALIVVARSKS